MDLQQYGERFEGFGPNPLDPLGPRPTQRIDASSPPELRTLVRQRFPKAPGIYGMLDRRGQLIYVGKSKRLRTRLLSYFSPRNAEEKAGRIIQASQTILWETQPSEFAALLREQQLIRRWTPRWNVQEIPKRQRPVYLCLGGVPAPYFFIDRMPPADVVASEGPFMGAGKMQRAVDALNNFFRLRDCSSKQELYFADQLQLFDLQQRPGCLRYEIGRCSGPCVGQCTRRQYDQQVAEAESFLDGFHAGPLEAIRETIQRAAEMRQYELAGRMSRDLVALEFLHRKLMFLAAARRKFTFVYAVAGHAPQDTAAEPQRGVWYLIRQGEVCESIVAPRCPEEFQRARPRVAHWKRVLADPENHRSASAFPFTLSLVANWLRKQPQELESTFHPSEAGRRYRDLARL
ncbi:UvrABC system protein C [Rosistilla carotiformis]|uniref:UvrABC system protein C n=1 Tax=Rosistilla carotiformis TaxID=2528017 RepID=A0A518JUI0_9BACT|nr:GIY-YIG nuclease family protein [Rosistilla carotiformis]QDV69146.1 UvrABC system protein C [Rosistilla carotiformis]